MKFIGIDLAWSTKNPSGLAALDGDANGARLVASGTRVTDEDILAFVDEHAADGGAIVAIDAPLLVPNETGRRPAEAELSPVFGRYQAGAHPANRQNLTKYNGGFIRGEVLTQALEARGFKHDPQIPAGEEGRWVVEVYPHPAMVALFGLTRTLKYKRKKQGLDILHDAWDQFHTYLGKLASADPSLSGLDELLSVRPGELVSPKKLKAHEDEVDAVMCAYIGLYAHRWPLRCEVFGNVREGYILSPTLPARWRPDSPAAVPGMGDL